ncbi:MAG: endonuclease/exonuclease/phosphatase family protein [bacterium]
MPNYYSLNPKEEVDRRTAEGLLRLQTALSSEIPGKTTDATLLLASWNIREFGGTKYGGRDTESLFYIAEIISHFDLVAIQEVRSDLGPLDDLMKILGKWWSYLVTDVTIGRQGNDERLSFLFDKRKMSFGGLAGEVTSAMVKKDQSLTIPFAFARSPYIVGFQAGWFKFKICTGHLYYGASKADDPQRVAEMEELVKLLDKQITDKDRWGRNIILLGDFNIFSTDDQTFKKMIKVFKTPPSITGAKTNQNRTKAFDQIAFISPDNENHIAKSKGGVFDYYQYVYRQQDASVYLKDKQKSFAEWRSYKMSDHLPLWTEIQVDFAQEYLVRKTKKPTE